MSLGDDVVAAMVAHGTAPPASTQPPSEDCPRGDGWRGPLAWYPHCDRCGKHHALFDYHHKGQCTYRVAEGRYCEADALLWPTGYGGEKPGLWCAEHSPTDSAKERSANVREASALAPNDVRLATVAPLSRHFVVPSNSRQGVKWDVRTTGDALTCNCEAGRTGHECAHKKLVRLILEAGIRELAE